MFTAVTSPIATFEGYRVAAFRQGRSNLAERTIARTVIHFVPQLAKVGVFLASPIETVTEEALYAVWRSRGCPRVLSRDPELPLLFGKPMSPELLPFAGCDDVWQEGDRIHVACKRAPDRKQILSLLTAYAHTTLLQRAESLLEGLVARGARRPRRIVVKALRPRILGQCTRDGEIRLNPSLLNWDASVLEETLAHELIHLRHFNHSPAFWRDLTVLLPDWLPRSLVHYL